MKLNEQIRAHRKKAGLTQEQVAHALGVSAPAVNKWESGATYPDITLLAPLARLLEIDLNTLFTFHEDLSREEIGRFCNAIGQVVTSEGFAAGFAAAVRKLQEYPTCDLLRFSLALLLEGHLSLTELGTEARESYERQLMGWYEQAAASEEAEVREGAIGILVNKYLAQGDVEQAQKLIERLPDRRPADKQMLHINVLAKQGNYREAAVLAERKIFGDIAMLQSYFSKLVDLDLLLQEADAAACVAEAAQQMAEVLGLWEYNRYLCPLQVAMAAKDAASSIELIGAMLEAARKPFQSPAMFRHLPDKPAEKDFQVRILSMLLYQFETDPAYDFLRTHTAFQELLAAYRKEFPMQKISG